MIIRALLLGRYRLWWAVCAWLALPLAGISQNTSSAKKTSPAGYEEDVNDLEYDSEFNYGVNFNTNGGLIGGGSIKYAWLSSKPGIYNRVMLEAVNIKHPKEARQPGAANSYIYQKTHYLFAVRPSFGKEVVLFRKAPEEGVHLNAFLGAGPTLGLMKPYYVLYVRNPQLEPDIAESIPYLPEAVNSSGVIVGVGRLTDGFDQLKVVPGAHFRGGLAFEAGRFKNSVFGIECGFVSEIYAKKIELMRSQPGRVKNDYRLPQAFNSLYITLYYGRKY